MKKNLLCILAVALLLPAIAFGQRNSLQQQALQTMKRATQFMMDSVSYNGGFVWQYLPDFSRQWGEMEAYRTMVWVQSGTPEMGHLLLDVYHATGDEYYYQQAEKVANALIWGQHPSGGWNYMFDFAGEASLKDWYATIGRSGWRLEEFQHYYGNATFDDAGTMDAANLLLRIYVEKNDPKFRPALDKAISFVLESQYPVGLWPQRYPLMYDYSKKGNPDYSSYITLNDDVATQNIDFLIRCYQSLGLQGVREPIARAMNALRVLQQGAPQAGWGLQYNLLLEPQGARTYEPNGISAPATTAAIAKLMDYYRLTGETKFLAGIPAAIDFLEAQRLPDSEVAKSGRGNRMPEGTIMIPRVMEIGTGLPRYIHRRGSNVYNGEYFWSRDIAGTVSHYSSVATLNPTALRNQYNALLSMPKEEATKGSPLIEKSIVPLPKYFTRSGRGEVTTQDVQKIVADLNARGYWPTPLRSTSNPYIAPGEEAYEVTEGDFSSFNAGDKYDTSPYPDPNPAIGISTTSYMANMFTLVRYLDTLKK